MGKRSNFKRRPHDFYATTDENAILPLLPHLTSGCSYDEPCAGDGALVGLMALHGHFAGSVTDLIPRSPIVSQRNVMDVTESPSGLFITNPPWSTDILYPIITHLAGIAPTWLLLSADFAHNRGANGYRQEVRIMDDLCTDIASVGRIIWMPGTKQTGKDNCAWYRLWSGKRGTAVKFWGRV